MSRVARRERGFTLLEVLVAFVIAALALGVMFDGVLSGLRAGEVAARTQEALAIARSRLAAVSAAVATGGPPSPHQEGDEGAGYHWTVVVQPSASVMLAGVNDAVQGNMKPRPVTLYGISVAVAWTVDGQRRLVVLDSARAALGAAPAS